MATQRILAVVIRAAPLTLRAQRVTYTATTPIDGMVRGDVVSFVPDGDTARSVRKLQPKPPRHLLMRHDGIVSCAADERGERMVWLSVPDLGRFHREAGDIDRIHGEPVELGDYIRFDVVADDGIAWEPDFRGRRTDAR